MLVVNGKKEQKCDGTGDLYYNSSITLCSLLELRSAFLAEARTSVNFLGTVWTKKIGQRKLRTAVLAILARRPHTAAFGTHDLRGITGRIEARSG
jgi:hypothetical protein